MWTISILPSGVHCGGKKRKIIDAPFQLLGLYECWLSHFTDFLQKLSCYIEDGTVYTPWLAFLQRSQASQCCPEPTMDSLMKIPPAWSPAWNRLICQQLHYKYHNLTLDNHDEPLQWFEWQRCVQKCNFWKDKFEHLRACALSGSTCLVLIAWKTFNNGTSLWGVGMKASTAFYQNM